MPINLRQPMPFSRGLNKEVFYILISGLAALALFYLAPFGYNKIGYLNLLGFGLVSIVSAIIYVVSTHYLYNRYWGNQPWTVGWEILHSLCFLLFIGICILVYGYLIKLIDLSVKSFFLSLFYTLILGLVPVTIRAVLVRNWRLKNELAEAQKMNELLANRKIAADEKIVELKDASSNKVIRFSTHELLYLEAKENYVVVVWEKDNVIKKEMIRMTMKKAVREIDDELVVSCHRSFIVNLRKVKNIISQSGISLIALNGADIPLPLSNSNKDEIKLKLKEF